MASIHLDALGLTPAQTRVAALVLAGPLDRTRSSPNCASRRTPCRSTCAPCSTSSASPAAASSSPPSSAPADEHPHHPRRAAPGIAAETDRRFADLLRSLSPAEWSTPTELPGWDVKAIACHVLGEAESYRIREALHQVIVGRKCAKGRALVDGMNDVQIADRAHLPRPKSSSVSTPPPPGSASSAPGYQRPMRAIRVPNPPYGWLRLGHLMDVVYTRDRWLHGVDICRAIGRAYEVDSDHDRRIVADVVAEWAAIHGQPYRLVLDGPAGGMFERGDGGEEHHLDAVEFCAPSPDASADTGLLGTGVVF